MYVDVCVCVDGGERCVWMCVCVWMGGEDGVDEDAARDGMGAREEPGRDVADRHETAPTTCRRARRWRWCC